MLSRRRLVSGILSLLIGSCLCCNGCERSSPDSPQSSPPNISQQGNADVRIVALSPAVGDITSALGYTRSIVGRHGYDAFLPQSLPICGDQSGINYERLIEVSPTLILTQWGSRELPEKLVSLAKTRGWILHDEKLLSLTDIRSATIAIDRLARSDEADIKRPVDTTDSAALVTLLSDMDAAWSALSPQELPHGEVALIGSLSPLALLGPGSCHHEILTRLGASTPAWLADKGAYVQITGEDIRKLNAEYYIIFDPSPPNSGSETPTTINDKALGPGVLLTSHNARVITHPRALTPGTAMITVAKQMRSVLIQLREAPQRPAP